MSAPHRTLAYGLASALDWLRSRALRATLRIPGLRALFVNRAGRLLALFLAFEAAALVASCFVPLWQLLLGPMIWGLAHLASSLRYLHFGLADDAQRDAQPLKRHAFAVFGGLAALYTGWRVLRSQALAPGLGERLSEWQGSAFVDGFFLMAVLMAGAWLYRKSTAQVALGLLVVLPLSAALWLAPLGTVGVLVLVHNVVGFGYWIRLARSPAERRVAWAATGLFLALSAAILLGVFAPLYGLYALQSTLGFAGMSVDGLGRLIFPWATGDAWLYATAAFAFGQSTHYFVWLKAIPDQAHDNPVPASFRQGLRLLDGDFGVLGSRLVLAGVGAGTLLWLLPAMPTARLLYFVLAGFHGYLEIAGLPLLQRRRA